MSKKKILMILVFCAAAAVILAAALVYVKRVRTDRADDIASSDTAQSSADASGTSSDAASASSDAGSSSAVSDTGNADSAAGSATPDAQADPVQAENTQTPVNAPAWTTARVNLREGPAADRNVIRVLPQYAEVLEAAEADGWARVTYENTEGYVSLQYLTKEEPTAGIAAQEAREAQAAAAGSQAGSGNTPAPAARTASVGGHVVVIDPGHQSRGDSTKEPNGPGSSVMKARVAGGTHGTTTGVYEYQLALAISQKLKSELVNRGYTVYMTRESNDVNISNKERAEYAASVGGEIAVRIHANGASDSSAHGALALVPSSSNPYISSLAPASSRLASCVLNDYCAATGMANKGVQASDTMTGINWSTVPVTILELGFMTNPTDDTNMENADYQRNMVIGIANGIDDYFAGQ